MPLVEGVCGQGHYRVVSILLEAKDINGRVAINWALENNHIKMVWPLWTHQEDNDLLCGRKKNARFVME